MRRALALALALALGTSLAACDKPKESETPEPATSEDGGSDEATAEDDEAAKWAERTQKAEAKAETVKARWTPELQAKYTELIEADYKDGKQALEAILASEHRAEGNADRDQHRHPIETLDFFGITPDMKVFEVGQGAGWYTEILAPYLAKSGTLYLAGPSTADDSPRGQYALRSTELFLTAPGNLYSKVETVEQPADPDAPIAFGADGSLDAIVVIRMMHNIHRGDMWDRLLSPALAALKPGGVLAVVQHRAPEGADPAESAPKGYIAEAWLIEKVEGYGFKLADKSEINANPKDTKDYEGGVWTLPPVLAKGDEGRDGYVAIGESDRATLRFVKPE